MRHVEQSQGGPRHIYHQDFPFVSQNSELVCRRRVNTCPWTVFFSLIQIYLSVGLRSDVMPFVFGLSNKSDSSRH